MQRRSGPPRHARRADRVRSQRPDPARPGVRVRSGLLTARTPVGGAVRIALTAGGDPAAADRTGATAPVDGEGLAAALHGVLHLLSGSEQDRAQLLVGERTARTPGVDAGGGA